LKSLFINAWLKLLLIALISVGITTGCKSGKKADDTMPADELSKEKIEITDEVVGDELQRVHFDYDKYNIRRDAAKILDKNVSYLSAHPDVWIQIEGHCDERGSAEYNLALGEKRANAARQYLVSHGINAGRISIISYGEEKPLENASDEYSWAMNRRAEFVVVSKGL